MAKYPKNYFYALSVMIGCIIGVGIFGLPYLTSKAGILSFLFLLIAIGLIQYLISLMYANLVVITKTYHRLPGYAGIYLGKNAKIITFIAQLIGYYGALLAYIIVTGEFLSSLLEPFFVRSEASVFILATIIFFIEAAVVYYGINVLAKFELVMSAILIGVVIMIAIKGLPSMKLDNFSVINWKYFLLPYGAMLFALDATPAITIIGKILNKDKIAIKKVIKSAMIICVAISALFTFSIVGMTGANTTEDALTGLSGVMQGSIIYFALVFGVVSLTTSFLGVAEALKESFVWDFKLNKDAAWALSVFIPYFLYLCGFNNFIEIISLAGAVAGGVFIIMLLIIFIKIRKKDEKKIILFNYKYLNNKILYFLILIFVCGMFYQFYFYFIKN